MNEIQTNQIFPFTFFWIVLNIAFFCLGYKSLLKLLLFSCILQSDPLLIFRGIYMGTPAAVTCIMIIIKHISMQSFHIRRKYHTSPILNRFILFFVFSAILTFVSAGVVFKGLPIFASDIVYSNEYLPLHITLQSIYIIVLFFIYLAAAASIYNEIVVISEHELVNTIEFISAFSVLFGVIVFFCVKSGLNLNYLGPIFFTQKNSNNFYDYINGIRFSSTFLEPSYASVFFAGLFWLRVAQFEKYNKVITLFILVGLFLTLGMTGYGAFAIAGIIYLFLNRKFKAGFAIIIIGIVSLFILIKTGYFNTIIGALLSKQFSITRHTWNELSMELFRQTHGIGIGLGMGRANSLAINLLMKTGIVGTALYVFALGSELLWLLKNGKGKNANFGTFMFVLTVFIGQVIADPDLDFCVFWFGLFLFCITSHYSQEYKMRERSKKWILSFQLSP